MDKEITYYITKKKAKMMTASELCPMKSGLLHDYHKLKSAKYTIKKEKTPEMGSWKMQKADTKI